MRQDMTMDEVMEYQGRLYYMPLKKIRERSEELLEFCGLIDFRKRTVRKLSGGMKRKLMVCRAPVSYTHLRPDAHEDDTY